MNTKKKAAGEPSEANPSVRVFTLRIIFFWIFLAFAYWLIMQQLPSQVLQHASIKTSLPGFLKNINPGNLHIYFAAAEVLFSASLLLCIFIPRSDGLLILNLAAALIFGFCIFSVTGRMFIPFVSYIILGFGFLYKDEIKFNRAFDFIQTLIVCVMLYYAATYYIKWYQYIQAPYLKTIISLNETDLSARNTLVKNIMPWYYTVYLIFIVRVFTTRRNKSLLIIACIVIFLEYFLNEFFDPALLFMLIPFINWAAWHRSFSKKFEPLEK